MADEGNTATIEVPAEVTATPAPEQNDPQMVALLQEHDKANQSPTAEAAP